MKRYFLILVLTLIAGIANAQMPAQYSDTIKINYVRTWNALAPISDPDTITARPFKDVKQTTTYFDGLGRPIQTVIKKGSLNTGDTARDFISPVIYDEYGRETFKYLPFAANSTGSNSSISDGKFKLNPFQQDSTFNKGLFSDESYYYNKNVFEASPLNRVAESYGAGNNWVGTASQSSEANRHGMKMKYWFNTVTDSVRIWTVTDVSNSFGTYSTSSNYAAGLLYKYIVVDEHNKQTIEFKDKEGKVLLKKVQLTADADTGTGKGYYGWLCTYYIYDDLGNLRCAVQPKGVELLAANSWIISYSTNVILNEQCFRYEYDGRARMFMKKAPGAGVIYIIYDARDRVVMSQDSVLRAAHKWNYILYDALNRDTTTGLITDATYYNNASYHRGQAATSDAYPNPASYTDEILTKKFYDNYAWRSSEGSPLFNTRINTYDSYLLSTSSAWPYPQDATAQSDRLKNMVTGTKTKILGTSSDYLYSVAFYDDEGRVIQTQSTNITGGTDVNNCQYSWNGIPLLIIDKTQKDGNNAQTSIVLTKLTYDDLWRPLKTEKKIATTKVSSGSMPGSWTIVSQHEYNALGQLKKTKLGATPLDSLNYEYNIRGWTLGMNRSYVKDTTSTVNWFGYDLGYDKTSFTVNSGSQSYAAAQYNGNINGMLWRSTGDDMLRKYDFTYDAANRFLSADFNQLNANSFSKTAGVNFSVSGMSYDANGNIQSMNQKGWKVGGSITIDSLLYGYVTNSNRLDHVTDKTNVTDSRLGDFKEVANDTSQDYTYDANGNLITDENKRITGITYNHLNLPSYIDVASSNPYNVKNITYTYDAAGNKLKKRVVDNLPFHDQYYDTTTTTYLNGVVFETKSRLEEGTPSAGNYTEKLQFFGTEEGRARIKADSSAVVYDYMIKDHLGNVRMMLTEERDTSFYPAATMETATATIEENYYSRLSSTREDLPDGYPVTTGNEKVAKVLGYGSGNGGTNIGPSILLKVMAGDKFNVSVDSWWTDKGDLDSPVNPLTDILNAISNAAAPFSNGHYTGNEIKDGLNLYGGINNFLNGQSYDNTKPKAYLNWMLVDEQFNYVSSGSGYEQVGSGDVLNQLTHSNLSIGKSGYLYVYVSNTTPNKEVYFDNLQVTHIRGRLLEESHYYPFGLTMNGISSKASEFGGYLNKKKFNEGTELNTDFDISLYETKFRSFDPQIGKFWQIDPLADALDNLTPYAYCNNNPILYNDPLGLDTTINGVFLTTSEYNYSVTLTPTSNTNPPSTNAKILPPPTPIWVPKAPPAITTPLTPPPAEVPIAGATPLLSGTALKALGFVAAVLSPLDAGPKFPNGDESFYLGNPLGKVKPKFYLVQPFIGHGNRKDNSNPHIVYTFTFTPPPGDTRTPVLKYGISDAWRMGLDRPENQLAGLKAKWGETVNYTFFLVLNREQATQAEQGLVDRHYIIWGTQPREQILPKPIQGKRGF